METFTFLMTSTFYPAYGIGGDALHVKWLSEELGRAGHQVHVLYSEDAHRIKRKGLPNGRQSDTVRLHTLKTPLSLSPYMAYVLGHSSGTKRFRDLLKEIRPDIVHHHNVSLLGYGLLRKSGSYLNLYTAHDYWLVCEQNNLLRNGLEQCEHPLCFSCALKLRRPPQLWRQCKEFEQSAEDIDVLIAPSNYLRSRISQHIQTNAVCIPNFTPKPPSRIEPSPFSNFFLYAGLLEKHKGISDLVHGYEQISHDVSANLIVAGEGSLRDWVAKFTATHGLNDRVTTLGWVSQAFIYRLLKDANALVIPSICAENCPLIALEALSVGTPIIASNVGGLPEIVSKIDGGRAYGSLEQLKRALLNCPVKSTDQERAAKSIHEKHYSAKAYLREYFRLIGDWVEKDNRATRRNAYRKMVHAR